MFIMFSTEGLSPRARGKQILLQLPMVPDGPIPASAGETNSREPLISTFRAYPRERGGNVYYHGIPLTAQGLSPRARGKQGC
ncbi:protein of unknown function [Candidatus Nitrotoga arctica]|uniref:Uncharacterized protein n=1 Tax=Candidatus Nitrotoga arctica TaxID=453162 RepID=A0ABN8ALB9_9PROT|nr:protein of unknown function [Candidatus Nitrotoga arctica]